MEWFNGLQRREQLSLLVGGGLLVLYLVYVILWSPLVESQQQLRLQNQVARESLVTIKELAAQYKQLSADASSSLSSDSLPTLIDQSVASNGLRMGRFQPMSSGDVQVRFENSSFDNLMQWLNQLEEKHGVVIKDLSINQGNATGLVNASVRLNGG